jgi:glycosyltransferase involved in cell wall biosynthesis
LRRVFLKSVQRVIVPSTGLERIARDRWRLRAERIALIPNGIQCDSFPQRDGNLALRAELAIPDDAFVVGYVGHLRPVKRPERVLEACALLRPACDVHVLMLGAGEERDALERLASLGALEGRVHFAGHCDDPRPYYSAMDAFALVSDSEQMPVALLEAMACGLPAVATAVGDVRRMLPDVQQELCHDLSDNLIERLAASLRQLADSSALRERCGTANRDRVRERYDFAAMLDAHRELWRVACRRER